MRGAAPAPSVWGMTTPSGAQSPHPCDVDAFLQRPLVARVVTINSVGAPTVRPVWFLWERGVLWWITGSYAVMAKHLKRDPRTCVVVDTCDLERMEFLQVTMHGEAEHAQIPLTVRGRSAS